LVLGAAVAAYDFRLFAYGATSPLAAGLTTPGLFPGLLDRLTFGYQVLRIVYVGLIVLYLVQRPELRALGIDDAPWVVASGIAFALQFLLLTSLVFADRALYFAPVPLALLAALTAAPFASRAARPESTSGPEAREAWSAGNSRPAASSGRSDRPHLHRTKLTHPNALVFAGVVLLLLVQIAAASQTYPPSLQFYSLSPSALSALRALEHQNGSVLLVSGAPVWFPTAFATGRPLYPSAQPGWFIAGPQVSATVLAGTLASGVAWIDAGPLKVVDAEPAWGQPSPGLFVLRYPDFVDVLRLNDSLLTGTFSPLSDRSSSSTFSLFPGARVTPNYSGASFARQYALPFVTVSKTVSVLAGGVVDIGLRYQFKDSVPRTISIPLVSDLGASATLAVPSPDTIVATVRAAYRNGWTVANFDASVTVTSTASTPGLVAASSEGAGGPVLVLGQSFAGPANATVGYDIRVRVANLAVTTPELVLEPQALMQTGIRVALIEKSSGPDVFARFERDPAWGLAFENAAFWEFQARLGAASAS
jgi:hypothetical protein